MITRASRLGAVGFTWLPGNLGSMKTAAIAALLVATTSVADADEITLVPTCVEIDEAADQLPAGERPAARMLVMRALERADLLVVDTGCVDTYSLSHERDGAKVIVRMRTARGARKITIGVQADMAATYTKMIESLRQAPALAAAPTIEPPAADRGLRWDGPPEPPASADLAPSQDGPPGSRLADVDRFDEAPPAPFPEPSSDLYDNHDQPLTGQHGLFYGRFGFGAIAGLGGSSFATGYRYGTPRVMFDIAFVFGDSSDVAARSTSFALKGEALYFERPAATRSRFYGLGLSLGSVEVEEGDQRWTGTGPQLEMTAGYDLRRAPGRTRFFIQTDLTVPLFNIGPPMDQRYAPSFVASVGIGR